MRPTVLIVDDHEENLLALEMLLEQERDIEICRALSGKEALRQLLGQEFALVLLDVQMPEMDGFEVAELMRANPSTRLIPIIFITAISKEERYRFQGYEAGAVDYLYKPLDSFILQSKVQVFIQLWRQRRDLELAYQKLEEANQCIINQKNMLQKMAIQDHLTGLYQRRWFDHLIKSELGAVMRTNTPLALAILDIDHFKQINDSYGHLAGDVVLVGLAATLKNAMREYDTAFRFGGEEFAVLLRGTTKVQAIKVCQRLRMMLEQEHYVYQGQEFRITVSIGLCATDHLPDATRERMIEQADKELYRAKAAGRNQVCPES
ncbi:GGDEF domain-containing response regulator [Candidatus Venteria ishoeyi]|uniref:diguanylate cyclase n=1 Tax=Candidatus Venteria ishoeyi TaxID=1899563 RepID=A0A1H6F2H6_9GAMM|nr:diguanylate cyclase [Candidatus Venteria ishoeyi]MDM8546222.1 diguanylate cyclase [Candidatus Venteria ishoeyi]SEH04357.1 Response regulator PleD [Candidatus Venteria ishoeyi]